MGYPYLTTGSIDNDKVFISFLVEFTCYCSFALQGKIAISFTIDNKGCKPIFDELSLHLCCTIGFQVIL